MELIKTVSSIVTVSKELETALLKVAKNITVNKGSILLNKGSKCTSLYFTESGLLRGYYFDEEKEITHWFSKEGEFATGLYSFISKESSFEYIQAIEDCVLTQISHDDLEKIYARFPETERLGRLIVQDYYVKLEERLIALQFKTAKERYRHLEEHNSALLLRAPLGQIASYLGITQETLSRIRAEN
ncbi:MAG: Crp/Fnr family transcriptional regulator [Bacteroidia bacterium]